MEYLLAMLINLLIQAIALPIAKSLVKVWTWLYTWPAPKDERQSRRAEVISDLHEQILDARTGSCESTVAFRILLRMLWGLKDDIGWFMPYLPSLIAAKLEAGGARLSSTQIPNVVLIVFAALIFHNGRLLISNGIQPLENWVLTNVSFGVTIALVSIVYLSPLRRRVESVWRPVFVVPVMLLMAVDVFDLYHIMDLDKALLAVVPVMLALGLNERVFRVYVLRGQQWPLPVLWGIILAISLSVAWNTGDLYAMLIAWGFIGLMTLIVGIAIILAINLASGALYGGISVTAIGMQFVATRIRRWR